MANSFLTMKNIAREALPILVNNLLFPNLIHQDFSADFVNRGDTIQVEKPPIYEANDFTGEITIQDSSLGSVDVKIDKLADVSVGITSKELTLLLLSRWGYLRGLFLQKSIILKKRWINIMG